MNLKIGEFVIKNLIQTLVTSRLKNQINLE